MTTKCYQNHKKSSENLSEEEKNNRQRKARERYQNFTEEEKNVIRIFLMNKKRN